MTEIEIRRQLDHAVKMREKMRKELTVYAARLSAIKQELIACEGKIITLREILEIVDDLTQQSGIQDAKD